MIATRIPPTIYRAVSGDTAATPIRADAATKRTPSPPRRESLLKLQQPRLPLDQRVLSYPLWWTRWVLLKASWVLYFPSWLPYQAARGVNWVGQNYGKVRSFAIAHAAGPVRSRTWHSRAKSCVGGCRYFYRRKKQAFCRGENGGRGCGCGHWRLAQLGKKLSLSGWRCPDGKFDYGWLGRAQRRVTAFILRSARDG